MTIPPHSRRRSRPRFWPVLATWTMVVVTGSWIQCATAQGATQDLLRARLETLQLDPVIAGEAVTDPRLLAEVYAGREFELAWADPARLNAFVHWLGGLDEEGLHPRDYHVEPIAQLLPIARGGGPTATGAQVELDIVLTDSVLRAGYHLIFGKVTPDELDPAWNIERRLRGSGASALLGGVLEAESLLAFKEAHIPQAPFYPRFKNALNEYREIQRRGGWPPVPDGPALKPGMRDERVPVLRRRLAATGDLSTESSAGPQLYDDDLVEAVERFQRRHGLDVDGVVGRGTLAMLNVPVEARIDQLRINMERTRWVFQDVEDVGELLVVNIAGFRVYQVRDQEFVWSTRAVVGKPYRKTPVFKASMQYLVFNPTWTVPPGILRKDILPRLEKDPGYLQQQNMRVLDRNGREIDPATIDWSDVSTRRFPYMLRQDPGPGNALGQVKFIFPNKHFVFLHDTPSRGLFERSERAFSSGCIRVEDPLDLATNLLVHNKGWGRERIDAVLASGKTTTVNLDRELPVLLMYWTAGVEADGSVVFLKDIYDRDQRVLEALDAPFRFVPPEGYSDTPVASN